METSPEQPTGPGPDEFNADQQAHRLRFVRHISDALGQDPDEVVTPTPEAVGEVIAEATVWLDLATQGDRPLATHKYSLETARRLFGLIAQGMSKDEITQVEPAFGGNGFTRRYDFLLKALKYGNQRALALEKLEEESKTPKPPAAPPAKQSPTDKTPVAKPAAEPKRRVTGLRGAYGHDDSPFGLSGRRPRGFRTEAPDPAHVNRPRGRQKLSNADLGQHINEVLGAGTDEAELLRMYFGVDGEHTRNYSVLAKAFELTVEEVRKIIVDAIHKLNPKE